MKPNSKPELSVGAGRNSYELRSYPKSWYYLCWLLYLCYCYAAFVHTGPVWGIHFIAYIPAAVRILLLVAGGVLLLPGTQRSLYVKVASMFGSPGEVQKVRVLLPAIVAGVGFILFHSFNMKTDIYGDSVNMLKWYGSNAVFDWSWITDVLNPHLVDNKEALTVALHRTIAFIFSIPIESSYRIVSELCGALFIFVWLLFVQKISSGPLRIVLILLGMFAGSVQVFFGHVENYSFGILTSTLFLIALYYYIEEKISTLAFVLLYLLAFKAHIIAILFLPAVLVALAYHYRNALSVGAGPKLQSLFTLRAILTVVVLPALVAGLGLYIFLFHSWNEPYALSTGRQFQQTFLPVISLPAPLDHYSLWSPYHIADFFNVLLLTAAPIVVVLATLFIFNRKDISWSQPKVIVFGLAALFPFLFFVAMNPTLSPVRDWDVYTLLFPPLLFFAAILMVQTGVRDYAPAWLAQSVVFGVLFTSVLVAVNASSTELGLRLEDAGAYTYRSYYAGSAYIMARGEDEDSRIVEEHYLSTVKELANGWKPGKDGQLAGMMSGIASAFASDGNYHGAITWGEAAYGSDTSDIRNAENLAAFYSHEKRSAECSIILQKMITRLQRRDTTNLNVPQLANVMAQIANLYHHEGNDSLSIRWIKEARKTDPANLQPIYDLAGLYLQANRPREALEELRELPVDSISANVYRVMAMAGEKAFGPDSALPYLYKANALEPNNPYVDSLIGEMKSHIRRKE